ncbi:hypothetical protein [Bosea lupini]|uniref:hypothetical protein n=1 Tax=Bosea lupini TaxID=1036779 RepID=UPI0011605DF1|nr:hypothetical protein [Bosea lupini]
MEVTAGRGGRQIDAPRHAPTAAPHGVPHEKADRKSSRFSPKLIRKAGFSSTKSKKTLETFTFEIKINEQMN